MNKIGENNEDQWGKPHGRGAFGNVMLICIKTRKMVLFCQKKKKREIVQHSFMRRLK